MIKLFTHNDLDGLACVLLAKLAFGRESVDFESCRYEDINDKLKLYIEESHTTEFEHCYITDISVKDEIAALINETTNQTKEHITLIDHHISAIELNQYPWAHITIEDAEGVKCSGTSLFYEALKGLDVPFKERLDSPLVKSFVEKVRRYDTWDWQAFDDLEAKQLNDLFFILGKERFLDYWMTRLEEDSNDFYFDDTQKLLLEIRQNEIDGYIESRNEELVEKEIAGYKAGIVFANRFQSELGNQLALLHPEYDFIAMINVGGGVSCRTIKEDVNLAEIAALFGGGGHAKAAGLPVQDDIREMVINHIFHLDSK
ncbi:MAG: oligoribonuclease [Cellulosilyticum sp.]|nr:oligoribonuclease [Cellulosilyticum sp.]